MVEDHVFLLRYYLRSHDMMELLDYGIEDCFFFFSFPFFLFSWWR